MRDWLMDDSGYHGLDECRNYETCIEEAYNKGYADAIKELFNKISTHNNIFRELGWDNDCIDLNTIKILCEQLKE